MVLFKLSFFYFLFMSSRTICKSSTFISIDVNALNGQSCIVGFRILLMFMLSGNLPNFPVGKKHQ